jgi:recombination protein RecT
MNPRLAECQPASVFACVIQASQLGLRPGLLGECYLIPYRQRDEGYVCTLQLGYQGLLELVRRSGLVESISAHLVRDADHFDVQWGTTPGIVHKPFLDGDPGGVRLVYAVARLKGGGAHAELMTLQDVERIRARSQNVINAKRYGKETPWDTDWDEMARKTVLRRICKYLPKSPDLATALALDDTAYRGRQQLNISDAIGNTFVPPPIAFGEPDPTTGEIEPLAPPPPAAPEPEPQRTQRARRKPAAEEQPPAPPPAAPAEQAAEGPPRRTYAELADAIMKATSAETASLVLDEAREALDDEQLSDLAVVYERAWSHEE